MHPPVKLPALVLTFLQGPIQTVNAEQPRAMGQELVIYDCLLVIILSRGTS